MTQVPESEADAGKVPSNEPPKEIKVPRTETNAALLTQLDQRKAYRLSKTNGSSHSGAATFRTQRLTALALVPLAIWFVVSLLTAMTGTVETARNWLGHPVHAALMAALVVIGLRHATVGIQSVLEDYVHAPAALMVSKLALYAVTCLTGLAAAVGLIVILIQSKGGA